MLLVTRKSSERTIKSVLKITREISERSITERLNTLFFMSGSWELLKGVPTRWTYVRVPGSSPPHTESVLKNRVEKNHYFQYVILFSSRKPHATLMVPWDGGKLENFRPGKSCNGWSWNNWKTPREVVGGNGEIRSTVGTCERCCSKAMGYEKN